MKMKTYLLLILAILVLGTVLILKHPGRTLEVSYALPDWQLPLDTSKVVKLAIRKGTASVIIERKHGTWRHERGDRLGADAALVNHLLKGVADFRLLGLVSSNPRKADLFDVGESGTNVIIGTDDGKEISLVVGRMTSLPSRSYVRPVASDMVYLARGLTPDVVEGDAFGGLRSTTFHVDTSSILMVSIEMGQTTLAVHRQGRGWISSETPIPAERMSPVLASLTDIRGERVDGSTLGSGGIPLLSVDILGQKRVRLEFFSWGSSDSSYILKSTLSPEPYSVTITMAQPLLQLVSYVFSHQGQSVASLQRTQPPPTQPSQQPVLAQPPVPARKEVAVRPRSTPPSPPASVSRKAIPRKTTETEASRAMDDEGVLSVHIVQQGETLESIAEKYEVTKGQLMQWNLLTGESVRPGTELYVFVKRK